LLFGFAFALLCFIIASWFLYVIADGQSHYRIDT